MEGLDRLTALWLGPLVLAGGVMALGQLRLPMALLRGLAWLGSVGVAALAGLVFMQFDPTVPGLQLVRFVPLVAEVGVNYHVGVDGISLGLLTTGAGVLPWLLLATWRQRAMASPQSVAATLVVAGSLSGAWVSLNLVPFLLFSELGTLALAYLLGRTGGAGRVDAATRFYLASVTGSLLLWAAWLVVATANASETGVVSFDWVAPPDAGGALLGTTLPPDGPWWAHPTLLLAAFWIGLSLRAPLFPFHGWLRAAASAGSATAAAMLVLGMTLAVYGFVRFALPLFPHATLEFATPLRALAACGVVYGAWLAFAQEDLRVRILGLANAQALLALLGALCVGVQGWNGSLLLLSTLGLSGALLLLAVGMLEERRGTRSLDAFGGVARPMPVFAFLFGLGLLAATGVPLFAGFVGETLILLGVFLTSPRWGVIAALGATSLAALGLVTLRRVLLGPVEREENLSLIDLGWRERWALLALLLPIVAIGLWPSPWLRRIEPAVIDGVEHVREARRDVAFAPPTLEVLP